MSETFSSRAAVAAAIRRHGGVTAALNAIDPDQMPDGDLREAWSHLAHARETLAHATSAIEGQLPDLDQPPARPTEPVGAESLVPGYIVFRHTERRARWLESWMPCCGRTVRLPPDTRFDWAVCCACRRLYDLILADDADGGCYAMFVVAERRLVAAQHRRPATTVLSPLPRPTPR